MIFFRPFLLTLVSATSLTATACDGSGTSTSATTTTEARSTTTSAAPAAAATLTAEAPDTAELVAAPAEPTAPPTTPAASVASAAPAPAVATKKTTASAPAAAAAQPVPATPAAAAPAPAAAFSHATFDRLLKKYVNAQGRVNYKGFKSEQKAFNDYLAQLSKNAPTATDSKAEQMAFWINAYNAYTIRLILDNYPLKSIKDIGEPWKKVFFSIGGEKMSLDNIEHGILRKKFDDPRIHFALVCASISCPPLRPEAYTAARLNAQLDDQARDFLNNAGKNKITPASAQLSSYFDWYKDDWNANGQSVVKVGEQVLEDQNRRQHQDWVHGLQLEPERAIIFLTDLPAGVRAEMHGPQRVNLLFPR